MTKLVWFLALTAIVSANDIQGVLPLGDDIKIDAAIKPVEKQIEENVKFPMLELTKSEPLKTFENSKDLDETLLRPIGPIFPSLLQPGFFGNGPLLRNGLELNSNDMRADPSQPKKGILTIILVKSKHQQPDALTDVEKSISNGENALEEDATQFRDDMKMRAENSFKTLTHFILNDLFNNRIDASNPAAPPHFLGGNGDPDHFFKFRSRGDDAPHLLGGNGDPDHFFRYDMNRGDNGDFIRYVKGDEMPILSDDIGRYHQPTEKACNLLRFLKIKAHLHYRTIVHLIFFSGILLIILMIVSLSIRVNKRRDALRRYKRNNIDISSIDSAMAKKREAEGLSPNSGRLFKLGSFKASYEQKMAPSLLRSAPPSYDQIDNSESPKTKTRSSLINSLAAAYKNRYQQASSHHEEEDRKSISSLPPYEEKPEPKN